MKTALITGIAGQDGSYLAELLLEKGYRVHGLVRPDALAAPDSRLALIQPLLPKIELHAGALEDFDGLRAIVAAALPDECYHLAAQTFVSYSFADDFSTMATNVGGTHHMLAALNEVAPRCRFFFAATSEMFGRASESPQNESTPFHPRSTYGISKVAGFDLTRRSREAFGCHASSGILYNHESLRRGLEFVTRKITSHAAKIKLGLADKVALGNLDAKRDWGHALDFVQAMWLMLQQPEPDDYVIATGETHSVQEFVEAAFACVDLDWRDHVLVDPKYFRPVDLELLRGDATKARQKLGWTPTYSFETVVEEMIEADLERFGAAIR